MRRMTRSERETFLAEPRVAVLSVAGAGDRPPHSTPTFYAYEPGGDVTFFTNTEGRSARKVALIADAGAVTLNVQEPEFPYRYVSVECRDRRDRAPGRRPGPDDRVALPAARGRRRHGAGGDRGPRYADRAVHGAAGPLAHRRPSPDAIARTRTDVMSQRGATGSRDSIARCASPSSATRRWSWRSPGAG